MIGPELIWLVVLFLGLLVGACVLLAALAVPFAVAVVKAALVGWAARALLRRLGEKRAEDEPPGHDYGLPRGHKAPETATTPTKNGEKP